MSGRAHAGLGQLRWHQHDKKTYRCVFRPRSVHHLTQGQVHAELPMEYLERIVEMWGQHTPPMHRSSVLLWLHDIDLTGKPAFDWVC